MSEEANFSGDDMQGAAAPTAVVSNESQAEQRESQQVPLSALQSEREKRQQLAEELQSMKDHLALMDASRNQRSAKPKDVFEEIPDDDIPTWGDIKRVLSKKEQVYESSMKEMKIAQKYPDYADVISKFLPEVIKQNPALRESLEKTQDYELAYYLAKNSDRYQTENKKVRKNADAEKIIQNAQMSGSLSSTGSVSPINTAKRYRDMTDDDFRKEVNRNLGYN